MDFLQINLVHNDKNSGKLAPKFSIIDEEEYWTIYLDHEHVAKIRKRIDYPSTYCYRANENEIHLGYGAKNPNSDDEFLKIVLNPARGLTIDRDLYSTLPIFYGKSGNEFYLSDNYSYVIEHLPSLTLNRATLINALAPAIDRYSSLWQEVNLLGERHKLVLQKNNLKIYEPRSLEWESSNQFPRSDPKVFNEIFSRHLDNFIKKIYTENLAFEISGGIDSATLPLYFAKSLNHKLDKGNYLLGALIFYGHFSESQEQKLFSIADFTDFSLVSVPIDPKIDYPLAAIIESDNFKPFFWIKEIYEEPFRRLAKTLSHKGVKTLSTGVGGDEVFSNNFSAEDQLHYGLFSQKNAKKVLGIPFITDRMRLEYLSSIPEERPYPLPILPVSLLGANVATNGIFIRENIWPVTPFANSELYKFCQGLPAHYRANKNILRAFHSAHGFPKSIYNPVRNEHFGHFFEYSIESGKYDRIMKQLAEESITCELGLIDIKKLMDFYNECKSAPQKIQNKWQKFFSIYNWICVEINLQYQRKKNKNVADLV